ncbi:MAG: L-lactate dehydrogenase [Pirellulaceae bacterium]|nr:L-lactate dehydrogenase [Pirellulaceae bacterium]
MSESQKSGKRKVVVIGAGAVGSTFCYALAQSGLANEIIILDKNEDLARGQVLDLAHGQPYFPSVSIRIGDASDHADADMVVVTAGAAQRPGQSRIELLRKNAAIIRSIVDDVVGQGSNAVLLIVTNPVDVLTHVALRQSGWEKGRVIGSGTVLDSARLRYLLSRHCLVDVHNVHAYVLGEHGDSEFAAWSMTHIAGMSMEDYCPMCGRCAHWRDERRRIEQEVRDSAYHIIDYKGATWFAVGMAMTRIVGAVWRNQRSVLTVSTLLDGEYGLGDVCLGVPSIVAQNGVERIVEAPLDLDERKSLTASAEILKQALRQLNDAAPDSD